MTTADQRTQHEDGDSSTTELDDRSKRATNSEPSRVGGGRLDSVIASLPHQYRGLAAVLCFVGVVFFIVGVLEGADVLFALGGIGIFSGVLTYYLTLDRFIEADVSDQIHAATVANYERLCAEFDLSERRIYTSVERRSENESDDPERPETPGDDHPASNRSGVRLLVPRQSDIALHDATELHCETLVRRNGAGVTGVVLHPTGSSLFTTFLSVLDGPLTSDPHAVSRQLSDAVTDEFNLARSVDVTIDAEQERMSVVFADTVYNDHSRFDHPLVSFFAVGLASSLESPVEPTVTDVDPLSVTFQWATTPE